MSLFGSSPPDNHSQESPSPTRTRTKALFDAPKTGSSLFEDDSPWDMPTPRKAQSRAAVVRSLLPEGDVPECFVEAWDAFSVDTGIGGKMMDADGVAKVFAYARLADMSVQSRIVDLVNPTNSQIGRGEFNVLMALVGLAQEGEVVSLDGVDERRRNLPQPKLAGLTAEPVLPPVAELAAKPPQTPPKENTHPASHPAIQPAIQPTIQPATLHTAMDPEDDPWNTPDLHKNHNHHRSRPNGAINGYKEPPSPTLHRHSNSQPVATPASISREAGSAGQPGAWGYFDGATPAPTSPGFTHPTTNPFIPPTLTDHPSRNPDSNPPQRTITGRTGSSLEETVLVTLMPEKEGIFMFQHHNYEVSSQRRASKVIRRYSDFVWLLDCLHKRYPFRVLPLLPPKRVGMNGSHLSNDGAFIEKRRRGLARFLNALVRHPVLGQEQLVVMFLTVPTELAVWRKQATISVKDEFEGRAFPPGLEESLPPSLEDLFTRVRGGVKRSAELYISICNIMDRLVKRQEGVAADHGRIALHLSSLTEASVDTYATDANEVPLLNDGLTAMGKHLRTCQALLEDESRGWDEGVLEDLKRQRDALVSVRELFERRERLDRDNIPFLERRIAASETKLAGLRAKPEVKPGEIEKVAESIIKDKESIVSQHNRSIFVRQTLRQELQTLQSTQYHVTRWNQDWAGERVKYAEMLADNWRRLLDELEGMPMGE